MKAPKIKMLLQSRSFHSPSKDLPAPSTKWLLPGGAPPALRACPDPSERVARRYPSIILVLYIKAPSSQIPNQNRASQALGNLCPPRIVVVVDGAAKTGCFGDAGRLLIALVIALQKLSSPR